MRVVLNQISEGKYQFLNEDCWIQIPEFFLDEDSAEVDISFHRTEQQVLAKVDDENVLCARGFVLDNTTMSFGGLIVKCPSKNVGKQIYMIISKVK